MHLHLRKRAPQKKEEKSSAGTFLILAQFFPYFLWQSGILFLSGSRMPEHRDGFLLCDSNEEHVSQCKRQEDRQEERRTKTMEGFVNREVGKSLQPCYDSW